MKMKRILCILLAALTAAAGSGCGNNPSSSESNSESSFSDSSQNAPAGNSDSLRTGLAIIADLSASGSTTDNQSGLAQSDLILIALTMDEAGMIDSCVIDSIQAPIYFDAAGKIITDSAVTFPSHNELLEMAGDLEEFSPQADWSNQASLFASQIKGMTLEGLKLLPLDENGLLLSDDTAVQITIPVEPLLSGIEQAVNSSVHLGAQKGDILLLPSIAEMGETTAASSSQTGSASLTVSAAAITMRDGVISSCCFDELETSVSFDEKGRITSDLAAPRSKNALGESYGLKKASPIGREWYQQAASFGAYVVGKSIPEVMGIAVDERGAPSGDDLTASVTISIGRFLRLIEKASNSESRTW